jgi:hypothetical protein
MPSIEELKQQHTLAHDRATAAQAALLAALFRAGDEVASRVFELDRANAKLGFAAQDVVAGGGTVHEHQRVPYLAAPISIELEQLLHDVRALPARAATAQSHQQAIQHIADHEKKHAAEHEARKYAEMLASPPAVQAVPGAGYTPDASRARVEP